MEPNGNLSVIFFYIYCVIKFWNGLVLIFNFFIESFDEFAFDGYYELID